MALPLAVGALALGYAAQGLTTKSFQPIEGDLLDALIEAPAPSSETLAAGEVLKALQAQRGGSGLSEPALGSPVDLDVRVALLGAGDSPTVSATGPWRLVNPQGDLLQSGAGGEAVNLEALRQSRAGGSAAEAWLLSQGGLVQVNGMAYAGRLFVAAEAGRPTLVNHLPLETYVASVVGSEMPSSWSMEALRAQAVAARSYALAHMARPANRHWHLGDNTRWQAYQGLKTSTTRTRQAVSSTAGLILSYQGAIVESLYAATREITLEAHGQLGASMSQHGAQELAEQGRRYNEILGHYYQGASLARLRSGAS
jgi:peptidoglycan hydrolase-like amidase